MISAVAVGLFAATLTSGPAQQLPAQTPVRRLILVAAANRGGEDRPLLKYALTDAERFSQVMLALGGTNPEDVVLLKQPRVSELDAALEALRARVLAVRRAAGSGSAVRTEVFFYYSGHADDKGLLLGNDRLSYGTLRERLASIPADVRIGVLDACASGAVTRPKGGKVRSPFTIDQSSDMRGQAFLTSSSADESAQESDRLGSSFFTHYLISGMRGAADVSADGRVTLNEAYQFAFAETLSRTVGTRGGPQHPVYDITMSGTGDVIVTDLRQTTAGFVVAAPVDGRFYVLDDRKRLVLEFHKPAGRSVDIGLEPGGYEVRFEREPKALRARIELKEGPHQVLDLAGFGPASLEFTRLRGIDTSPEYRLNGRHQVGVMVGMWNGPGGAQPVGSRTGGLHERLRQRGPDGGHDGIPEVRARGSRPRRRRARDGRQRRIDVHRKHAGRSRPGRPDPAVRRSLESCPSFHVMARCRTVCARGVRPAVRHAQHRRDRPARRSSARQS